MTSGWATIPHRSDAWYPLAAHLADVERECAMLHEAFGASGLSDEMRGAAIVAGQLHDIGKASPVLSTPRKPTCHRCFMVAKEASSV